MHPGHKMSNALRECTHAEPESASIVENPTTPQVDESHLEYVVTENST